MYSIFSPTATSTCPKNFVRMFQYHRTTVLQMNHFKPQFCSCKCRCCHVYEHNRVLQQWSKAIKTVSWLPDLISQVLIGHRGRFHHWSSLGYLTIYSLWLRDKIPNGGKLCVTDCTSITKYKCLFPGVCWSCHRDDRTGCNLQCHRRSEPHQCVQCEPVYRATLGLSYY